MKAAKSISKQEIARGIKILYYYYWKRYIGPQELTKSKNSVCKSIIDPSFGILLIICCKDCSKGARLAIFALPKLRLRRALECSHSGPSVDRKPRPTKGSRAGSLLDCTPQSSNFSTQAIFKFSGSIEATVFVPNDKAWKVHPIFAYLSWRVGRKRFSEMAFPFLKKRSSPKIGSRSGYCGGGRQFLDRERALVRCFCLCHTKYEIIMQSAVNAMLIVFPIVIAYQTQT